MTSPAPARGVRSPREYLLLLPFLVLLLVGHWPFPAVEQGDGANITIPRLAFLVDEVRQGRFPLWNEYAFCGTPLFADGNTIPLHPATLLYFVLSPAWAMTATIVLVYALLLAGSWAYWREVGFTIPGALVATCAYALSGQVVFWIQYHGMHLPLATLPLVLFLVRRHEATGARRWAVLAWLVLVASALGGFIQLVLLEGLAVVLEGATSLDPRAILRQRRFRVGLVATSLVTASVAILPSVEAILASHRGLVLYGTIFPPHPFSFLANVLVGAADTLCSQYPHYFYALGGTTLAFALFAIRHDRRRALRSPLLVAGVAFFALAWATYLGLLPRKSDPFRGVFVLGLALATWAAEGVERFLAEARERLPRLPGEVVALGVAAALIGVVFSGSPTARNSTTYALGALCFGGYLAASASTARRSSRARERAFLLWIAALFVANAWNAKDHWSFSVQHPARADYYGTSPSLLQGNEGRVVAVGRAPFFREDWAIASRIRTLGGHGSIFPRQVFQRVRDDGLIDRDFNASTNYRNNTNLDPRTLARFGVRFLLLDPGVPKPPTLADWPPVGTFQSNLAAPQVVASIFENPRYVGRAYFLDARGEIGRGASITGGTSDRVTIQARGEAGETLVLADSWFPGWRCTDNGLRVEHTEERGFRAYRLPTSGEHTIEWRFEPRSLEVGALVSLAGLALSLGAFARLARRA